MADIAEEERLPLIPSQEKLTMDFTSKLTCIVYAAALILVGFLTAIFETVGSSSSTHDGSYSPNGWICWAIKNAYMILSIVAICCLKRKVFKLENILKPFVYRFGVQKSRQVTLVNVPTYVETVKVHTSELSIWTLAFFSILYFVNVSLDLVCSIISVSQGNTVEIAEVLSRAIRLVFCGMQTSFLVKHNHQGILWKVSLAFWCGSQVIATNIALWFINVGLEIHELNVTGLKLAVENWTYCDEINVLNINRFLYPFVIEYYVISAFMALTILINTGLSPNLQRQISDLFKQNGNREVKFEQLMRQSDNLTPSSQVQSELAVLRSHPYMLLMGLGLVVLSLVASVFVLTGHFHNAIILCVLYSTLAFLCTCGILFVHMLYTKLNDTDQEKLSWDHFAERYLLWIGTLAIAVNEIYTLWVSISTMRDKHGTELAYRILLFAASFLNLLQSSMQVCVLECALNKKLKSGHGLMGRAVLNLLMLLNISQWLLNTICIDYFINHELQIDKVGLIISSLTVPLQVFFRFHSVCCLHDFKRHLECDANPSTRAAGANYQNQDRRSAAAAPAPSSSSELV